MHFFLPVRSKKQLSFSQVRARKRVRLQKSFERVREFSVFFFFYISLKAIKTLRISKRTIFLLARFFISIKEFITRKLIWGRGRLIRPFISFGILSFSMLVFLTGGFYQHKFVVADSAASEFVSGVGDIIPERITATTELPSGRAREGETKYVVKAGDTISSIGSEFGVTVSTIMYANKITNPAALKIGQKLVIPPVSGVIHTVKKGDTLDSLAKKYSVATQAIADFNYLNEPFTLAVGAKLIIPDAKIPSLAPPAPVTRPSYRRYSNSAYASLTYANSGPRGTGTFIWPVRYRIITQYFSWYHPAIDIARLSPLYASDGGVVVRAGWWANGYGFAVQIDHRNGYVTTYAHMSRIDVSVGDTVSQGEMIGMMGSTGRSTGPHVHFTIQYNGQFLNPLDLL